MSENTRLSKHPVVSEDNRTRQLSLPLISTVLITGDSRDYEIS